MKRDELRALLEGAGIRARRSSGQNFLVEENLADAIAREGRLEPEDVALEVGTGLGILTARLLGAAHHVVSVEMDARVLALAREVLADAQNLTLVEGDALASKSELSPELLAAVRERLAGGRRLRVVANLPYNVATTLVLLLLSADLPLASMVVMVQLEAAQRFAAEPGDPQYGAVSLLCAALCERIRLLRRVPPEVFMPRPKVHSAVVLFEPRAERRAGYAALEEVVRGLFNYRRKTLHKAAREAAAREPGLAWLPAALAASGLDERRRPEELALDEVRRILGARADAPRT